MTGRFIGKTYTEYRREFVEHLPYGKRIGKFSSKKERGNVHKAQQLIFLGMESEKSENQIIFLEN